MLLLFLGVTAAAALSGRWGAAFNMPVQADRSQWQLHVRYGVIRGFIAERDSKLNGQPPGLQIEDMSSWRFEWGIGMALEGATRFVQVPLWFPALILLSWLVLRTAGRQWRKVAGKCLICGRLLDHEGQCVKCSQLSANRPLR